MLGIRWNLENQCATSNSYLVDLKSQILPPSLCVKITCSSRQRGRRTERPLHHIEGNKFNKSISVLLPTSCLPITPSFLVRGSTFKCEARTIRSSPAHDRLPRRCHHLELCSAQPVCLNTESLLAWCQSPFLPTCITKSGNHSLLSKISSGSGKISSLYPRRVSTPPGT